MPPPSPLAPAKPAGGTPPHAATTHPPSPLGPAKTAGGTPPHAATTHPTSPPCRCGTWGRHANGTPTARQRHANGTPTARQRHANGTPTARQRTGRQAVFGGQGEMGKTPPPCAPTAMRKTPKITPPTAPRSLSLRSAPLRLTPFWSYLPPACLTSLPVIPPCSLCNTPLQSYFIPACTFVTDA